MKYIGLEWLTYPVGPQLRLPTVSPWQLTSASAALLVLFYNDGFWKTFSLASGGPSLANAPFYMATFAMLVLVFNAFLSLASFRYVLKPVLAALFCVAAASNYFIDSYRIVIDASMVQSVLETDLREARELFNWNLLLAFGLMGVLPSLLVCGVPLCYPSARRGALVNGTVALLSLCGAGALLMAFLQTLAPAVRDYPQMRLLLTPTNAIQAGNSYLRRLLARPLMVAPLGRDAVKGGLWTARTRRTVTLVVVGETARAMNFSLNGYARDTNPLLARQAGLVNFSNVRSCGTATAVSVPCVFSGYARADYARDKGRAREGLLDVLSHAGLEVLWRNNNSGCKGVCDRVAYEDLSQPAAGDPLCDSDECFDERMLRGLPELIRDAKRDLVVVLHQKGSHGPAYWKRYPARFERFGPVCKTSALEKCSTASIVAAYDNSIAYTDYFLSKAIDLLRASAAADGADTALMYFSDHGESLGEKNMYLRGAPYILAPEEQRHVPLMVWLDDGFRDRFNVDQRCLEARRDQEFSHDNVFHSLLGMLNLKTVVYNPQLDLFHACQPARRS